MFSLKGLYGLRKLFDHKYKMHGGWHKMLLSFHFKASDTTSTFKVLINPVDVHYTDLHVNEKHDQTPVFKGILCRIFF